jgi:transcription elongation factor Elf1
MKNFAITLLAGLGLLAAGCAKDNITPPTSQLTGRITYQNQPLNVRGSGNVQLELWQRGEYFRNKIQVFVAQDGTYSADLFDGDYKLTRLRDNGPWQNNTDSISVTVKGNTVVDVPVQPYFTVGSTTFAKANNVVTASCKVNQVSTARAIESVSLFINYTQFVDNSNVVGQTQAEQTANTGATLSGAALANLGNNLNLSFIVPAAARGKVLYARVGVKTQGVGEMIYSPVQQIAQ